LQTDVEDPVVDRLLLGGFLSEKYSGHPEPKKIELTTQSLSKYKHTIDQRDGGWMLFQELLLVLSQIADKHKVSISNVAVCYIADKPAVVAVIIGARLSIAEHITSNQATFSFPGLDQGDVVLIHAVVEKGNGIAGDCGDEYH
jgi:aryl-alcohol dehydrogenase-like predicted oxidoreductase